MCRSSDITYPLRWAGQANKQPFIRRTRQWTAKQAKTSSTQFRPLPELSDLHICAANQALAELHVKLAGASAAFRVEVDRSGPMQPGPVRFTPDRKHDSFSLAFIRRCPILRKAVVTLLAWSGAPYWRASRIAAWRV
jgi:hypothetical protein